VQEAAPIADEELLEAVNLTAKSFISKAHLGISKDIINVSRVTSRHTVKDATVALYVSPTTS